MIATKQTTRATALLGRLERERLLSYLGLALALALSAGLNLWNLAQNGYANLYYSVAVQSMLQSWHNFFFAAYDAGGFISVDKPPVALWVQVLSAMLLGFTPFALLLPEALAGVAAVALVYYLVRRLFGPLAASVAALALAVTPIAVAVDRGNKTDTLLMLAAGDLGHPPHRNHRVRAVPGPAPDPALALWHAGCPWLVSWADTGAGGSHRWEPPRRMLSGR